MGWQYCPVRKISVVRRLVFGGIIRAEVARKPTLSRANVKPPNYQLPPTEFHTKTAYFSVNASGELNMLTAG